jgi:hypothetical protein
MSIKPESFTPGPWKYSPWHIEEGEPAVRAPEGWIIANVNSDPNAQLIAAAPDMYEALMGIIPLIAQDNIGSEEFFAALEALTKARGES